MAQVTIRDEYLAGLREAAAHQGVSPEEKLNKILEVFFGPKWSVDDMDFSDPANRPSFKEVLFAMPDVDTNFDMRK